MHKYKLVLLLYLVVSSHALSSPETPEIRQNAGSHRIFKRDVEKVHSIDIQKAKEQLIEAYREIKPLLENLVAEIAPSIHEKITQNYLPVIQSLQNEVMPFFNAKVYPQLQKYLKFGLSIAEKLIEKTYRAYKLSNSTHIAVVSVSDLIDEVFTELKPIIEMGKYLSARMMVKSNYRGKRDVSQNLVEDDSEVHLIDIQKSKESLVKAYQAVKPLLENLLAEVSPSIYEEFELNYFPKLRELKQYIIPFVQSSVLPQVEKYLKFATSVIEKLVDRTYRSYHLSNSTHINIVSISDIIEEVYKEFRPILDLVKYLSARMSMGGKHFRGKRDVSEVSESSLIRNKRQVPDQLPDLMVAMFSPALGHMVNELSSEFSGDADSLISKVLIPVIFDILSDPESRWDFFKLTVIATSSFSPVLWDMIKLQSYNPRAGSIIRIPRQKYDQAQRNFQAARPIIKKLMDKYTPRAIQYAMKAEAQIVDLVDHLFYEQHSEVSKLKHQFLDFVQKHRDVQKTSTSTHVHYYSLAEIAKDFEPIKIGLINLFYTYVRRNPGSVENIIAGENGILQRVAYEFRNMGYSNSRPVRHVYRNVRRG